MHRDHIHKNSHLISKMDSFEDLKSKKYFNIEIKEKFDDALIKKKFGKSYNCVLEQSKKFNLNDFFEKKRSEAIKEYCSDYPYVQLNRNEKINKITINFSEAWIHELLREHLEKHHSVLEKRDAIILDFLIRFESLNIISALKVIEEIKSRPIGNLQIPLEMASNSKFSKHYIKSGIIQVNKNQWKSIEYVQFLASPDLTIESFLESKENVKKIMSWTDDIYQILRNINYLAITSSCTKILSSLNSNRISTSIENFMDTKIPLSKEEVKMRWRRINEIMNVALRMEYFGLESFNEMIGKIFNKDTLVFIPENHTISLKDWLLVEEDGITNFQKIAQMNSAYTSLNKKKDIPILKKWFGQGNRYLVQGFRKIMDFTDLNGINRKKALNKIMTIFESFETLFKLGSTDAFGIMLKNIAKNKRLDLRYPNYPKLTESQKNTKGIVATINCFFKIWNGDLKNIITPNEKGLFGLFASDPWRFDAPSERQFLAIDSIILFFVDNLFQGDMEKFNNWNQYATQTFYKPDKKGKLPSYSGSYKNYISLMQELGSSLSRKALLTKNFTLNGREVKVVADSFFEKDLLDDIEECQDSIAIIIGDETYRKLLAHDDLLMHYLFDKQDGKGESEHPSILDIGIVFNQLSHGLGFMIEGLGFAKISWNGKMYGPKKEVQLTQYLKEGFCPIYIPYNKPREQNFYFNCDSNGNFVDNVQKIGYIAPLLDRKHFALLMHVLSVSEMSFSDTMRLLGCKCDDFDLSLESAITIQRAFGLNVNNIGVLIDKNSKEIHSIISGEGTINVESMWSKKNMIQWWQNYSNSNQRFTSGILNKMYAQLHFIKSV